MQLIEVHKVKKLDKAIRLQEYSIGVFISLQTKSSLKKAIKKGLIFVDGKVASTALLIKGRETIELYKKPEKNQLKKFDLSLEILFEDDYLAIINKPAGISVSGNKFATIDNALEQNLKNSPLKDATKPRPVHRLDYPTSGLLLVGKTTSSIIELNKLFENKKIRKKYHAITIGKMKPTGSIDLKIDDKDALSEYLVLKTITSERFEYLNLVQLNPKTGRRHQLRKHLKSIGNHILGDKDYYKEGFILKGKGLYLHASSLEFIHPFTEELITVTKELPKKFKKIFPSY